MPHAIEIAIIARAASIREDDEEALLAVPGLVMGLEVVTGTCATLDTDTWMFLYVFASSLIEAVRSVPHEFLSDSFVALVRRVRMS